MILMVFASPVVPGALYTTPFPLAGTATHPAGILTAVPFGPTTISPFALGCGTPFTIVRAVPASAPAAAPASIAVVSSGVTVLSPPPPGGSACTMAPIVRRMTRGPVIILSIRYSGCFWTKSLHSASLFSLAAVSFLVSVNPKLCAAHHTQPCFSPSTVQWPVGSVDFRGLFWT